MLVMLSLNIDQLIHKPYNKIMPATSVNSDVVGFLFFNYRYFKSKAEGSFAFEISIDITLIK